LGAETLTICKENYKVPLRLLQRAESPRLKIIFAGHSTKKSPSFSMPNLNERWFTQPLRLIKTIQPQPVPPRFNTSPQTFSQ
jgi:hypothetical protein